MTGWAVVVPVKSWASAKSRVAGISTSGRRALAKALAHDTVSTVCATPGVAACFVVGAPDVLDFLVRYVTRPRLFGVEEQVGSPDPLNAALRRGRDAARCRRGIATSRFFRRIYRA